MAQYGVYNTVAKQFQFGISEPSKTKAENKLKDKIGHDAKNTDLKYEK